MKRKIGSLRVLFKGEEASVIRESNGWALENDLHIHYLVFTLLFKDGQIRDVMSVQCEILVESVLDEINEKYRLLEAA